MLILISLKEPLFHMAASGVFAVGDLRVTFQHDSTVSEESYIEWNSSLYKVRNLTRTRGMKNDVITHVVAYGKKVPRR